MNSHSNFIDQDLADWVKQAADLQDGVHRLLAIEVLKKRRLGQVDAHSLCQFFSVEQHPSVRATAAQILGYHGASKKYPEVMADVLRWALKERDPLTLQAMVFALRETEGAIEFLTHGQVPVAREAIVGVPEEPASLRALLEVLFDTATDDVTAAICRRLGAWQDVTKGVIAFLMTAEIPLQGTVFLDRVTLIFSVLPQAELLVFLTDVSGEIERTYTNIWPGMWRRERQRSLLDIFANMLQTNGASESFLEALVLRISSDEDFYNRYIRFIRSLLRHFDIASAQALISLCEQMGLTAKKEGLSCLAEMLVGVIKKNASLAQQVQEILGRWETQLPGIQMKAFYATR